MSAVVIDEAVDVHEAALSVSRKIEQWLEHIDESSRTPYAGLVPKEYQANLDFRAAVNDLAEFYPPWRDILNAMCARDPIFFVNVFGWTYDPRKEPSVIPMVTWENQDHAILDIDEAVQTGRHRCVEKSRDQSATWNCVIVAILWFLYHQHSSILFISRVADCVDKQGDFASLFGKVDFFLERLPHWICEPKDYVRKSMHIRNLKTGSMIDGEATTGDVARGDRRRMILMDEFASVPIDEGFRALGSVLFAANCVIFNSTPKGASNAFYKVVQNGRIKKLRLHWTSRPDHAAGLYRTLDGKVDIIDKDYAFPPDYEFILDGKTRSPWYDDKWYELDNPTLIAQELDIDYVGSGHQFFVQGSLDKMKVLYGRAPFMRAEISYEQDSCDFIGLTATDTGRLHLWANVDAATGLLLGKRKTNVGVDIATGTGSSNSVITIGDIDTKEKIGEWCHSQTMPHDLAKVATAIRKWLMASNPDYGKPKLIWEANGPGRIFGKCIMDMDPENVFYRKNDDAVNSVSKMQVPGWYTTNTTKETLLGELRRAYAEAIFVDHSVEALNEAGEYQNTQAGSIEHAKSIGNPDPTGAKNNHGDRVIATALLWWDMQDSAKSKIEDKPEEIIPDRCFYARAQAHSRGVEGRLQC